jgi:hypothetical protein
MGIPPLLLVCLDKGLHWRIFPPESEKKSFGSTYTNTKKIEAKKTSRSTIRPPPKSAISTFDDGGHYSSVIFFSG